MYSLPIARSPEYQALVSRLIALPVAQYARAFAQYQRTVAYLTATFDVSRDDVHAMLVEDVQE